MSAEIADSLSNELDRKTFLQVREKFPQAEIVNFSRQTRWRPSWDVELQDGSGRRRLIVRAEKGKNYVSPISLQQEADIHRLR